MRMSLSIKLTVGMTLLLGVSSAVLLWGLQERSFAFAQETLRGGVRVMLEVVARPAAEMVEVDDTSGLVRLLTALRATPDVAAATITAPGGRVLARWPQTDEPTAEGEFLATSISNSDGETIAELSATLTFSRLEQKARAQEATNRLIALLVTMGAMVLGFFSARWLTKPIESLSRTLVTVSDTGNLSQEVDVRRNDETGYLARALVGLLDTLGEVVRAQQETDREVQRALANSQSGLDSVQSSSTTIRANATEGRDALRRIHGESVNVSNALENLQRREQSVSLYVQEVAERNTEVTKRAEAMSTASARTERVIRGIAESMRNIANTLSLVDDAVEQATASMVQMNTSVSEVRESSKGTAELSRATSTAAKEGVTAVEQTIDMMNTIERTNEGFATTMQNLAKSISDVDQFVVIIDEVANQTTLLALNASIIASQAGEYGRAFNIVANEIKALASKTRASTQRITASITSIQDQFRRALKEIDVGVRRVRDSASKTRDVQDVFERIRQAAERSDGQVSRIAEATSEQAHGISYLTETVSGIAVRVREVSATSQQQARHADSARRDAAEIESLTREVRDATRAQTDSSIQIVEMLSQLAAFVADSGVAQKAQLEVMHDVLAVAEDIDQQGHHQGEVVSDLRASIDRLDEALGRMRKLLTRFSV